MIHSKGTNIGKSYLSNLLLDIYPNNSEIVSFSSTAIDYLETLIPKDSVSFKSIYTRDNKNSPFSMYYPYSTFKGTLRDFITSKTLNYKSSIGDETVFTKQTKTYIENTVNNFIVIDDFRLPYEYELLNTLKDINILTLKISKPSSETENLSDSSKAFENQLKDFKFNIDFQYTEDYSNTQELLDLIRDMI